MKNSLSLLLGLLIILIVRCSQQERDTEKIAVVVTLEPFKEFVERIGGNKVIVSAMVPPGASPHTYEPTPAQLIDVSKAKMYVKVGTPIDFELIWLSKILLTNNGMLVNDASEGIERLKMEHGHESKEHRHGQHDAVFDPHIWLSPKNAKIIVENIYNGFSSIDPDNEKYYRENKNRYLKELTDLDRTIKEILGGKTKRKFMVYHPAWGYFAQDYDLEQIAVESEGKEPTAGVIQHLIEQAEKHDTKVIFASLQFNAKSAEVIAKEIQGRVILIDPLDKNYVTNMRRVAQAFSEALE